jgi:hypothetical protein
MSSIFRQLPLELFDIILLYCGETIKKRNGKYMNQIPMLDRRYTMLNKHLCSRKNTIYDTTTILYL